MIVTNTNAGNFLTDGVYINQVPATPALPAGPQTGLLAIVGSANYGPVNQPTPFTASADAQGAFGNGTALTNALILAALCAMPECAQFLGVRVTDGTDAAATISLTDASAGIVGTLTNKYTGSYPNVVNGVGATARLDLQSGTTSTKPVFRLTLNFPNQNPEVFAGIVAYTTTAYDAPTFKANLLAAVNGTIPGKAGSVRWTATSGASTLIPQSALVFNASGGVDGATTITSAVLTGTDGVSGRTGMYALRGLVQAGQVLLAGLTDATVGATLTAFAAQENCLVWDSMPQGTDTPTAVALRATNNLSNPSLLLAQDYEQWFDTIAGVQKYVNPMAKCAGIIASLPAYLYPGNKPYGGANGVIGTERTATPLSLAEGGQRQSNGLLYLTNNPILFNRATGYGLPHGMTSDGVTTISDARMLKAISYELQVILGPLVGEMQGVAANDPFRRRVNDRLDQYFQGLLRPGAGSPQQIAAYSVTDDLSNNNATSVGQGLNIGAVEVTTLSAARFILVATQVGSSVAIIAQSVG